LRAINLINFGQSFLKYSKPLAAVALELSQPTVIVPAHRLQIRLTQEHYCCNQSSYSLIQE